ncbi:LacI family transcriptional regulator [Halobacillus andaensis]|uniref:LacI family transcriptional regulator n=1 Tax=Halobacillus andaensis TaxID=1176239 RepID=A0A917B8F5_HALAA|nr:substrate-binding domain-containing protein [Halobacillus andaensis]MBP2005215.1 LacI family transcriptional regulator [Halobacillus andaensis]GGF29737.1 LacI family transcriptional regulator [Halobacillus andaensis]
MAKKVTMQDIADQLNISKNSVSQALTGKPGVSDELRKLVHQVAKELGYKYNRSVTTRSYNQVQSGNIALIASDFAFSMKSFFGEIYLTIEEEVNKRNKNLLIQSINKQSKESLTLPSFIENKEVDGVLILSHISNEYIQKVLDTGIPTVLIDHHHPSIHADAILTNNRFGAYTAVQHLIELGHKNIAFVGDTSFSPSYQERLEGFLLALKDYGIEPTQEYLLTDAPEESNVLNHFIGELSKQPSAWFCVNDGLGYLITSGLQQHGIQVPSDASVCSFDNGQLSQLSTPSITTMDISFRAFGQNAIEKLFWRMENPEQPYQEILLPATLIKRDSTKKKK